MPATKNKSLTTKENSKVSVHNVKVHFHMAQPGDTLLPVDTASESAKSYLKASERRFCGAHPTILPGTYFSSRHDLVTSGIFGAVQSGVHTFNKTVLSLLRGAYDKSGSVRKDGTVPYEMSGGRLSATGKDPYNSPANVALRRAIKKKHPIRLTMAVATALKEMPSAKFRYMGLYVAKRMRKRRTAEGRRVILLKPQQKKLPSSSLWQFHVPSFLWQGTICPKCSHFLSATTPTSTLAHSQICQKKRPNASVFPFPKEIGSGRSSSGGSVAFLRLSMGSYLYYAKNLIAHEMADEIFCHLLNNTKFEYRVFNNTSPENKLTAHVGDEGVSYTYARSPRVAQGWGALEKYLTWKMEHQVKGMTKLAATKRDFCHPPHSVYHLLPLLSSSSSSPFLFQSLLLSDLLSQINRHLVWNVLPYLRSIFDASSSSSHSYSFEERLIARETYQNIKFSFAPNFCLMNLYCGGHQKMNWHQDNETVLDQYCVVSLSFGQVREFRIRKRLLSQSKRKDTTEEQSDSNPKRSVYKVPLGHGSVLVMMGSRFQKDYEHCLSAASDPHNELGPRLNLTFRVIQQPKQ